MAAVMIGVDPHKRSNTAVVMDRTEKVLGRRRFANDSTGTRLVSVAPGKRVTMCLTDAGERDCVTLNAGAVSVSMTIRP